MDLTLLSTASSAAFPVTLLLGQVSKDTTSAKEQLRPELSSWPRHVHVLGRNEARIRGVHICNPTEESSWPIR